MNRYYQETVNGITYQLDRREAIDCGIAAGGWERPVLEALRRHLKPGMFALDIGANVGAHALPMAQMVGPIGFVQAFEPMAYAFTKLCVNSMLNPDLRILPMQLAFGVENYSARLQFKCSWPMDGFQRQDTQPTETSVWTLDLWCIDRKIDLIKLDVDGNEYGVLYGGRNLLRKQQPVIIMEVVSKHFEDPREDPLLLLREFGYTFLDIHGAATTYDELKKQLPFPDPDMRLSINCIAVPK